MTIKNLSGDTPKHTPSPLFQPPKDKNIKPFYVPLLSFQDEQYMVWHMNPELLLQSLRNRIMFFLCGFDSYLGPKIVLDVVTNPRRKTDHKSVSAMVSSTRFHDRSTKRLQPTTRSPYELLIRPDKSFKSFLLDTVHSRSFVRPEHEFLDYSIKLSRSIIYFSRFVWLLCDTWFPLRPLMIRSRPKK